MQPVGAESTVEVGWLTYARDEQPDAVTCEERLELLDIVRTDRTLGEDDDLDGALAGPRRLKHPISQVQVQQLPGCELEEPMRVELDVLNRSGRLEVLRFDA